MCLHGRSIQGVVFWPWSSCLSPLLLREWPRMSLVCNFSHAFTTNAIGKVSAGEWNHFECPC